MGVKFSKAHSLGDVMDLREMTQWRIQFLEAILKPVPEKILDRVPAGYAGVPDLSMKLRTGVEWVDTLLDQIRWYSHLFPGREQCDPDFMEDWSRLYLDLHNFSAYLQRQVGVNDNFQAGLTKVVDFGIRAMNKNKWAFDFLRPDQLTTVQQARTNLSNIGYNFLPIYEATKAQFDQPLDFNFFLNSEVFTKEIDGMSGMSNVNLIGAPTGTGKTRMSLVASNGHLAFSNEVVPFAPQRVAVFVRTRSQTQAFLKESKRLGLTVSCPISTSLGCSAHNKQNKKFLDNISLLFEKMQENMRGSLKLSQKEILIPDVIPVELYPSVSKKSDTCLAFSQACVNLLDLSREYGNSETFLSQWRVWCKDKKKGSKPFLDLYEYLNTMDLETELREAKTYLMSDSKCRSCPASPNYFRKDNEDIDAEILQYGNNENPRAYFNRRMDKDADINKIAEDFQRDFGFCGRDESKKSMAVSDVVIFTYNWLIDPGIAQHAYKAMKTSILKGSNPAVAAICDEAHFLYDFNEETSFGFQNLFEIVGKVWHAKLHYMDQETFKVPGVENPVVPSKSGTSKAEFALIDSSLKHMSTFMEKFCSIDEKDNTPTNLFCLASGHKSKWYPAGLYSLFIEDFAQEHKKDPIASTYNALIQIVNHCDSTSKLYEELISQNEEALDEMIEDKEGVEFYHKMVDGEGSVTRKDWVYNAVLSWRAGGKRNKVNFQRVMNHLQNGTYEAFKDAYIYIRNFAVILREILYSVGGGTFDERILSVSTTSPSNNNLYPTNILDGCVKPAERIDEKALANGLNHYLMMLATVGKSQAREWETSDIDALSKFYQGGGGIFRGLELRKDFRKEIKASFKVNKPMIQTALRPYPYITFLTGTPADPAVWRTKSGFRYFVQANYPNYNPLDYFEIKVDEKFELKQATKGELLFRDMAKSIQEYTGDELTLVCYPSKLTMKEIMTQMPDSYKESCIVEAEGINLDLIQAYAENNPKGAIHAVISGRFLEGVEFTDPDGNSLVKKAIIVGVPFNPPTEENKQIEAYLSKQFHWDQWQAMNMLMYLPVKFKIKQAIGRTVRNLTDHGKVILLDKRYETSKMLKRSLGLVQ